jgi:hypothetical protein
MSSLTDVRSSLQPSALASRSASSLWGYISLLGLLGNNYMQQCAYDFVAWQEREVFWKLKEKISLHNYVAWVG